MFLFRRKKVKTHYLYGIVGVCLMFSAQAADKYQLRGVIDEQMRNEEDVLIVTIDNKQYRTDYEVLVELPEDYNEEDYGPLFSEGQLVGFDLGIAIDEGLLPRISKVWVIKLDDSEKSNRKSSGGLNRIIRE